MELADIATFTSLLKQLTPKSVPSIPAVSGAFEEFFSQGDGTECWELLPEKTRLAVKDYVKRQDSHASQQQRNEPRQVNLQAGRKPRTDAAQTNTTQAASQANTADTSKGRKRPLRTANGLRPRKARTASETTREETTESTDTEEIEPTYTEETTESRDTEIPTKEELEGRQEYWDKKKDHPHTKLGYLRYLAAGLAKVETTTQEEIQQIWAKEPGPDFSGIAPGMDCTTRAYILHRNLRRIKNKQSIDRFKERFITLLYGHDIDQSRRDTSFTGLIGQDTKSLAFEKVARKHKVEREGLKQTYHEANIYLECAKVGGAGTLLTMKNMVS
ncbi:hypothetical protein PMIN03_013000 [Paraphaeosphaeria minitans]